MTQTATLLVLFSGALAPSEQRALDAFARDRELALVAPPPTPGSVFQAYRPDEAVDLEGRLDEARTFASSLDEERALSVLALLERALLGSPALPQAAFLMAERHLVEAELRRAQPGGATAADQLEARARALEGARVAPFDSTTRDAGPEPPPVRIRITDLGPRDRLELDGEAGERERTVLPGQHHVRVLRDGELVHAAWVEVASSTSPTEGVRLGVRPVLTCSREDLGTVDASGPSPIPPRGVACPRWVAVRRVASAIEVAACARSRCEPFERRVAKEAPAPAPLPAWAKTAIAGAATAGTILLSLWAAGAFAEKQPPDRTIFVYRGVD